MKIKIDSEGHLSVNGNKKNCPFAPFEMDLHTADSACGGWCALFGEPEIVKNYHAIEIDSAGNYKEVKLQLCHKTLFCEKKDFTDERGK